ncbi:MULTISPECIES: phytoene/squalene synthase family protein [unclassified Cupriavidus]|uniref:phytoene/squalene synthase family protein n=1 Tax=unclassified Cupriavidus TaxID=2640874 RepID=UPI001C0072D0|nr:MULTISPECIES: phytoene/squalene synthase family protein [unclassified Cupriavidus]MCA3192395.1 squalene/phytoene synthase family protein [Cupriavidus sp.]MCA3196170.1 squalene/phytoene synthase family protein [Cupriavidus sp.]MCA3203703.1 squalene/phytoene synthase family protein [Cupriavidus sp.]MCA3210277.1 squalene/phytoene synthase family protein [Cupriavidus sp.]QWE97629.1 phytoene/squalene synthase family protein [Cupriavidus sp. EM10]
MPNPNRAFLLGPLLKGVSRSFYLTLRVLPAGMRDPVGLAYLLARAADTIADTSLIPPAQRLDLLLALRQRINGADDGGVVARRLAVEVGAQQTVSDEKVLLESIAPALDVLTQLTTSDRVAVQGIVTTLTEGMEFDLQTFPDEQSGQVVALPRLADLDRYTYLVAGCVGEFWTTMTDAHLPGTLKDPLDTMLRRGVRFGKALQMVNVLRDVGKDLRIGRCYLPAEVLDRHGLTVPILLDPANSLRARPMLHELVRLALDHFREAMAYTFALPRTAIRLRLACLWPILIGLETLALLVENGQWLDPARVSKVNRNSVYRILWRSSALVMSDTALRNWMNGLVARIDKSLR